MGCFFFGGGGGFLLVCLVVALYLQINGLRDCYKLQKEIEISTNWMYLYINTVVCSAVTGDIKLCLQK